MNGMRKLAEIPAGSWTKWVVVGFWVVVLVLAFPLSLKLMGAEKNDAKYWLPGNAESTKVLDVQSRFQSPNVYTGVVVYVRASGITAADRAKAAADARRFAGVPGVVPGRIVGPIVSADGKAIETILQVEPGLEGLCRREQGRRCDPRDHQLERGRPGLSHHRPAGGRGRQQQRVQEHQRLAAVLGLGGRDRDLADHLPEPGAVAAAGDLLRGGADHRPGGDLPAGGACRPDGHRAERRHLGRAGVRREHRLRAADRRAVPGGTAPPRPPSPGDGHRAAARGPGDHRQRCHRGGGAADADCRGPELDQQPGAGAGDRRRGRHVRHDHLAARAAGDLPPRGLLAVPAHLRLGRADPPGDVGAGRLAHRLPAAAGMDHYRRDPRRAGAGPDRAEGQRPDQRAVLPRASRFGDRRDRARRAFPRGRGRARHRDRQPKRGGRAAIRLRRIPQGSPP